MSCRAVSPSVLLDGDAGASESVPPGPHDRRSGSTIPGTGHEPLPTMALTSQWSISSIRKPRNARRLERSSESAPVCAGLPLPATAAPRAQVRVVALPPVATGETVDPWLVALGTLASVVGNHAEDLFPTPPLAEVGPNEGPLACGARGPLPARVLAALDRLVLRRVSAGDSGRESSSRDCTPLTCVGRVDTAAPDHLAPPWCWGRLAPDFPLPPGAGIFNPEEP